MRQHLGVIATCALLAGAWSVNTGARQQRVGGAGANATGAPRSAFAITGTVRDAQGKTVPDMFITAVRPGSNGTSYEMVSANLHTLTDAQGVYRLEPMSPGEFFVVALPHNEPIVNGRLNRIGYGNTFYPSAAAFTDAKLVLVRPTESPVADITLVPATLALVSGTVVDSKHQIVRGGRLSLSHGDNFFGFDGRSGAIRPDGTFSVGGLQPGTYFFRYQEQANARGRIGVVSGATVVVKSADLSGVNVEPIAPVRVTGKFLMSDVDRKAFVVSSFSISDIPKTNQGNPGTRSQTTINDDLTFEFYTWPGEGKIRVLIYDAAWSVKAVRQNGADITNVFIPMPAGGTVSGVAVELVRRGR